MMKGTSMEDTHIRIEALKFALTFYSDSEVSLTEVVSVAQAFYDFLVEEDVDE